MINLKKNRSQESWSLVSRKTHRNIKWCFLTLKIYNCKDAILNKKNLIRHQVCSSAEYKFEVRTASKSIEGSQIDFHLNQSMHIELVNLRLE